MNLIKTQYQLREKLTDIHATIFEDMSHDIPTFSTSISKS